MIDNFEILLRNIPKNKPIGSVETLISQKQTGRHCIPNETEENVIKMFEEKMFRQIIDFQTCGSNILDTAFYQNCLLSAEFDKSFSSIYNLTDHEAIRLSLGSPVTETKPLI